MNAEQGKVKKSRLGKHLVDRDDVVPILICAIVILLVGGHIIMGTSKVSDVAIDYYQTSTNPIPETE